MLGVASMVILRLIFIVLAVSGTAARKDESMKVHRPLPGQWPQICQPNGRKIFANVSRPFSSCFKSFEL